MKKSRYTEEQIAYAMKQAETGTPVAEVIRRMGISEQTFYRWKKLYGGLGVGVKKSLRPDRQREIARYVQSSHAVSERRSCAILTFDRRSIRYPKVRSCPWHELGKTNRTRWTNSHRIIPRFLPN